LQGYYVSLVKSKVLLKLRPRYFFPFELICHLFKY
jgi:hypothetical protein